MLALARVGVFVEMGTVEVAKPDLVLRKMRRHPIEDHADSALVKKIYKVHKVRWSAESASGRKVAGHLITPGAIERMLHDRHQLEVSETRVVKVIGEERSHLTIGEPSIAFLRHAAPRAEMRFIDRYR